MPVVAEPIGGRPRLRPDVAPKRRSAISALVTSVSAPIWRVRDDLGQLRGRRADHRELTDCRAGLCPTFDTLTLVTVVVSIGVVLLVRDPKTAIAG